MKSNSVKATWTILPRSFTQMAEPGNKTLPTGTSTRVSIFIPDRLTKRLASIYQRRRHLRNRQYSFVCEIGISGYIMGFMERLLGFLDFFENVSLVSIFCMRRIWAVFLLARDGNPFRCSDRGCVLGNVY